MSCPLLLLGSQKHSNLVEFTAFLWGETIRLRRKDLGFLIFEGDQRNGLLIFEGNQRNVPTCHLH